MARIKVFKDKSQIDADKSGNIANSDTAHIDRAASLASRKAHLDAILDDALDETFPASDPISIDFEPPQA